MTIGLKDWERMRAFLYSGWEVPAAVENKRQEQLAKWYIRINSAEWAEDMLERVQDSQQAWRSKMEDYLVARESAA